MMVQSRRTFIQRLVLALALTALARVLSVEAAQKRPIPPPSGETPVPESDPVASAVGYHLAIKDIDYKKFPQRSLPSAKNQFCRACMNYTAANEGWGKCLILNGLVSSQGWCGSWINKTA